MDSLKYDSIFFSAGHALSQFYILYEDFETSLYYSLLLKRKIIMPDNTIICGNYVSRHLDRFKLSQSWLETGFQNNYINIYLKDRKFTNLQDSVVDYRKSSLKSVPLDADKIAYRIDDTNYTPYYWPPKDEKPSAELYKAKVIDNLRDVKVVDPNILRYSQQYISEATGIQLSNFWEMSEEWRRDWIDDAIKSTDTQQELRLSDIVDIAANKILNADKGKIDSIKILLSEVKRIKKNPNLTNNLALYFIFLCDLYNQNLADVLSCQKNSIIKNPENIQIHKALAGSSESGSSESGSIELPKIKIMKSVDGTVLREIRNSYEADCYFESLDKFYRNGDENSAKTVSEDIQKYARKIRSIIRSEKSVDKFDVKYMWGYRIAAALAGVGTRIALSTSVNPLISDLSGSATSILVLLLLEQIRPFAFSRQTDKVKFILSDWSYL